MTSIRLLYIDDDPAWARLIERQLGRYGHQVFLAEDAASGLARLAAGGIDAVVLDHNMPGPDGLATLREINAVHDPPPVLFVTGADDGAIAVKALKLGAADYVVKGSGDAFAELLDTAVRSALAAVELRRDKEAAEREIRAARDRFEALATERAVLLREVDHRIGNSLQLIAAILHMQGASSTSLETRAALEDANRRVLAIAQLHRRLYASEDVTAIALDAYLQGLVDDLRQSTDAHEIGDLLSVQALPVMIDPDRAVTLGIVVTELVINALKHAYPGASGPIRVILRGGEVPHAYVVAVEDDGVGRGAGAPSSSGLGRTIIQAMARKLDASVDFADIGTGTSARLAFALPPAGSPKTQRPRAPTASSES